MSARTIDAVDANRRAKAALIAELLYSQGVEWDVAADMDQPGRDAAATLVGKSTPSAETWEHVVRTLRGMWRVLGPPAKPGHVLDPITDAERAREQRTCSRCRKQGPWNDQPCFYCRQAEESMRVQRIERGQINRAIAAVGVNAIWPATDDQFGGL